MWKKLLLILLSLLLILTFAACHKDPEDPGDTDAPADDAGDDTDGGSEEDDQETGPEVFASGIIANGSILWEVYTDNSLVLKGAGAIPDYTEPRHQPWIEYSDYGRSDAEGGVPVVRSIVIGEGITSVGEYAFADFEKLQTVTLPASLTQISYKAFMDCIDLHTVSGGTGVEIVDEFAFENCLRLSSIELSSALTTVAYGAFYNACTSLADNQKLTVRFKGNADELATVAVDANGNAAFTNATKDYITA